MSHRLPIDKAEVSGAAAKNPARYRDKSKPKGVRSVGKPYKTLSAAQQIYWKEFVSDLPWLNSSHRQLLRVACILAERADNPECGIQAIQALSAVLSKLGATPVDETKVNYDPGEEEDVTDEFFHPRH